MNDQPSSLALCRAVLLGVAPDVEEELPRLDLDADVWDELELDSMDQLNVLTELSRRTGRDIPEADYGRLRTLRSLAEFVAA